MNPATVIAASGMRQDALGISLDLGHLGLTVIIKSILRSRRQPQWIVSNRRRTELFRQGRVGGQAKLTRVGASKHWNANAAARTRTTIEISSL